MDIAVIGGGGREHAIIKKIKTNPEVRRIYALPGNGGIAGDATCVPIQATDLAGIVRFAKETSVDYVIISPDDPLVMGLADALEAERILHFGPNRAAAQLEGSKRFAKSFMERHGIPTSSCASFEDADQAARYVKTASCPLWVKADGLALGKGAVFCENPERAAEATDEMMRVGAFGAGGKSVVIEEHMEGVEVTALALTDGEAIVPLPSAMDFKRARDGDEGPNTGGMGAISPNPHYSAEIERECMSRIFLPTIRGMKAEGRPFRGCLYFQIMLTASGPKVVEYNCRFGDPEAQAVLERMDSDLLDAMLAVSGGRLSEARIRFRDNASACVVVASGGYPEKYEVGFEVEPLEPRGATFHHAGTELRDGKLYTSGGRVIGATATGSTLSEAVSAAYRAADGVRFTGAYRRSDIGAKAIRFLTNSSTHNDKGGMI